MNGFVKVASGLLALGVLVGPAAGGSLVVNGSFEDSANLNPGAGWTPLPGGSGAVTGWTTLGDGVDYMGTLWPSADGIRCIDLNNTSFGGMSQAFETAAGAVYTVTFALSANMFGGPAEKRVEVSAAGESMEFVFDYVAQGATSADPKWTYHEWQFTADGPITTLAFTSKSGGVFGPALDDVVVTGIPTPGAAALVGIAGIAAVGRRRPC